MRVYHLIKSLGRGGAEMLLPEGLREADPSFRWSVGYFLPHKNALVGALEERGVRVHCFNAVHNGRILTKVPRVAADIRRWKPDVVHCHLPIAGVAGRLAGRLAGVPVVYTEHNLQERYHPLTAGLNRRTWRLQTRVVACSQDVRRSIHERIGERVPVQVVQNGVATAHFVPDEGARVQKRDELGISASAPVMTTVAVFRSQKRLTVWLEVAAQVLKVCPDAHFFLVGAGPLENEVDAAIQRLGLEERVHRPGLVEEVRPWLAASDVYMMSSEFEGLPVALLEAMSMGLPAVCTAVGGIDEVIREGVEGHLVDKDAPMELVQPVVALFQRPEERLQMSKRARQRVVDAFGMRRMMGELEALYRSVAS